jgi:hypothetical protein
MKTELFPYKDIVVRYIYSPPVDFDCKKLFVIITNPVMPQGHSDFMFSFASFKSAHRLYIPSDRELGGKGLFLLRNSEYIIRDALLALLEQIRVENGIRVEDVYLFGHCLSSITAYILCLEKGYNGVLSMFTLTKNRLWEHKSEYQILFDHFVKWEELYGSKGYYFPDTQLVCEYTGLSVDDLKSFMLSYMDEIPMQKLAVPKFYLHYGENDISFLLDGNTTIETMAKYGMHFETMIDSMPYNHFEALPYVVKFFVGFINKLRSAS